MNQLEFQAIKNVKVEAKFDTPEMTSDFGTVILRESRKQYRYYFKFQFSNK